MTYKTNFYTRFEPAPPSVYGKKFSDVSMTEQSLKPLCDINNLLKTCVDKEGRQHAEFTGLNNSLPAMVTQPRYGDFTMFTSEKLLAAKNMVAQAQQKFELLPAELRARFSNDPAKLIEFVNDPNNYDEGVKLGLFAEKVEKVEKVEVPPSSGEIQTETVTATEK